MTRYENAKPSLIKQERLNAENKTKQNTESLPRLSVDANSE